MTNKPKYGTVGYLVQELLKLPQELNVYGNDSQGYTFDVSSARVVKVADCQDWASGNILSETEEDAVLIS